MRRLIRWIRQQDRIDELLGRLELAERQIWDAYQEGKRGQTGLFYWHSQAHKDSRELGREVIRQKWL